MKEYSYVLHDAAGLTKTLEELKGTILPFLPEKVLFSLYSASAEQAVIETYRNGILKEFPHAKIIGASTSGEISKEQIYEHTVVLTVLSFETSTVHIFGTACRNQEEEAAQKILAFVHACSEGKGLEILADLKNLNDAKFFSALDALPAEMEVFGGGSDAYDNSKNILVFTQDAFYPDGAVCAVYCGKELQIQTSHSLGWKSLGRMMDVTQVSADGMTLEKVDGRPATEIYRKYLNLQNDTDFHQTVDKFPIMLQRSGKEFARVPIINEADGSIVLGADIAKGEKIKLGYGDPNMVMSQSAKAAQELACFQPQGILLFSCITRKGFLKDYAVSDAQSFAAIAPLSGFYTYGEILRLDGHIDTMNCTLVCVGMREGMADTANTCEITPPKLTGYMSVIDRLIALVEATTADLEEANQQLQYYASHDRLTGVLNRGEIETRLHSTMKAVNREIYCASVVMFDIDDFKKINDTYGHDAGDHVLQCISKILREKTRAYDHIGRWGGEEFFLVLIATNKQDAYHTGERIRQAIANYDFGEQIKVTISLGVTEVRTGEELIDLYRRVDEALYHAKENGKNQTILV